MEKKRTSKTQFKLYLRYIRENPVFLTGKLQPTSNPQNLEKLWDDMTKSLNSCGDGPVRETNAWKKVFTEWKSMCRKKARENKPLAPLEEEILKLTGRGVITGLDVYELGSTSNKDVIQKSDPSQVMCSEENLGVPLPRKEMEDEPSAISTQQTPTSKVSKEEVTKKKLLKKKGTGDILCESYKTAVAETGDKLEGISLAILEVAKAINRYCDIVEASQTIEYIEETTQENVEVEDEEK